MGCGQKVKYCRKTRIKDACVVWHIFYQVHLTKCLNQEKGALMLMLINDCDIISIIAAIS